MSNVMKAYKDRVVRSLYATTDTHIIAEMLGEDATAVRNRAARLGIKKPIVAADTLLPPEKQAILVNTMLELSVKIVNLGISEHMAIIAKDLLMTVMSIGKPVAQPTPEAVLDFTTAQAQEGTDSVPDQQPSAPEDNPPTPSPIIAAMGKATASAPRSGYKSKIHTSE